MSAPGLDSTPSAVSTVGRTLSPNLLWEEQLLASDRLLKEDDKLARAKRSKIVSSKPQIPKVNAAVRELEMCSYTIPKTNKCCLKVPLETYR